ncbi:cholinesterase-like [Haemaphysalis longicornis]
MAVKKSGDRRRCEPRGFLKRTDVTKGGPVTPPVSPRCRYIYHFEGDKRRLTLFGQDVGATSIGFHLARNATPFQRAVLMSGSPFSLLPSNSGHRAVLNANALAGILGCGAQDPHDAASRERAVRCMRKRSIAATIQAADQLATSSDYTVYVPSATRALPWVLGGPMYSKAMLRTIDFLVGVSRDEGTTHVSELLQVLGLSADQTLTPRRLLSVFRVFLESNGIRDVDKVVQYYGFNRTGLLDETLGQLFLLEMARPVGDFLIYCPTLFFLEEVLNASGRAFVYEFMYNPSYRGWPTWQGVPQFVDFMFATGLLDVLDELQPASSQDRKVARDLSKVFAAFVNTGNPNALPNTIWRRWSHSVDAPLSLDYNVGSAYRLGTSLSQKASCKFWRPYF